MTLFLEWRTVTPSNDRRRDVRGTELNFAFIPGTRSRLAVYAVRTIDRDGFGDAEYVVRDAGKISDTDVKAGKRPPIVARYATLDELERAVDKAHADHPEEFDNSNPQTTAR